MMTPTEVYDNHVINWKEANEYIVPFLIQTNEGDIRNMEYVFYDKWDREGVIAGLQDVLDVPTFYSWPFE